MDIFQRNTKYGGAFNIHSARLNFGLQGGVGMSFDSVGFDYNQQISRIWDLGSGQTGASRLFLVAGHPVGTCQLARAIGPSKLVAGFYQKYGDVCNSDNQIGFSADNGCTSTGSGTRTAGKLKINLKGVLLQGTRVDVAAANPLIRHNMVMAFAVMEWLEDANNANAQRGATVAAGVAAAAGAASANGAAAALNLAAATAAAAGS